MQNKLRNKLINFIVILTITTSSLFFSTSQIHKSLSATYRVEQTSSLATLPVIHTGLVTSTKINVRTKPENTSKVFVTLSKGAKVSIVEQKSLWYKIKTSKGYGWVMSKYVAKTNTEVLPVIDTGTITSTKMNVRKEPKNTSTIFVTLSKGGKVSIVEKTNLWYKIKTSKGYGWVLANSIKLSTTQPSVPAKDKFGKVTASTLHVRTGPSVNYTSIGTLTTGKIVTILSEQNGWYQITSEKMAGWVNKAYIQLVNKDDAELSSFTLVIDPGHGGQDPGATFKANNGVIYKESNVVLQVSQYLKSYFSKLPIKSFYTRQTDVYLTLDQRVNFSKSNGANAFISIHTNASTTHKGEGTETYYYGQTKGGSDISFSNSDDSPTAKNTLSKTKLQDSKLLAEHVQRRLVEKLKLKDRGVKTGNFHVIRETPMASILTELGFIDNPTDNVKLTSVSWQKEAAKGIYLGVLDYLNHQGYPVDLYYIQ